MHVTSIRMKKIKATQTKGTKSNNVIESRKENLKNKEQNLVNRKCNNIGIT